MPAKKWAVVAYIVADDERAQPQGSPTLNEDAMAQVTALQQFAKDTGMLVVGQVDFTKASPKKFVFPSKKFDPCELCLPDEVDSADPRTLSTFLDWAATEVKDRQGDSRLVVIFWGHSGGPSGLFRDPAPFSLNPTLKLPDLARSLTALHRPYVDLLIFQGCWVSTLEVAYELKTSVRYMIASQQLVRPMKVVWPFGKIFAELQKNDSPNLAMLSNLTSILTDEYRNQGLAKISFSALTLDAAASLADPLTRFADALNALNDDARKASRDVLLEVVGSEPYKGDGALMDVLRLCKRLRANQLVSQEALDLERVVNTLVVQTTATAALGLTGVSLFRRPLDITTSIFAADVSLHAYNELALSADTTWPGVAFEERFQYA
jgi:hypothetical protein